jgi:hypothetical protein
MQNSPITSWVPSAQYLEVLFLLCREVRLPGTSHPRHLYQQLRMSMVTGRFMRTDDNFQLPKSIRGADGQQIFICMNTVMNEHGEIACRYLKPSVSHDSIIQPLKQVAKRALVLKEEVSTACVACICITDQ